MKRISAIVLVFSLITCCLAEEQTGGIDPIPATEWVGDENRPHGDGVVEGRVEVQGQTFTNAIVVLTNDSGEEFKTALNARGRFEFRGLKDADYSIRVIQSKIYFNRFNVRMSRGEVVYAEEIDSSHGRLTLSKPKNIVIPGKFPYGFFPGKQPFAILGMLKSPFTIVIAVSLVLVLLFPRIVDSMSDELVEELTGEKRPPVHYPNEHFNDLID